MKQSTTQDQAYLKECLAFHERRANETSFGTEAHTRHTRQVKWFKAKLQGYFRIPVLTQIQAIPAEPSLYMEQVKIAFYDDSYLDGTKDLLTYTKPTPIKDFFHRALNRIRGV